MCALRQCATARWSSSSSASIKASGCWQHWQMLLLHPGALQPERSYSIGWHGLSAFMQTFFPTCNMLASLEITRMNHATLRLWTQDEDDGDLRIHTCTTTLWKLADWRRGGETCFFKEAFFTCAESCRSTAAPPDPWPSVEERRMNENSPNLWAPVEQSLMWQLWTSLWTAGCTSSPRSPLWTCTQTPPTWQ